MKESNLCKYFTEISGGCRNQLNAGDKAKATPYIAGQPWTCSYLTYLKNQPNCPGFEPRIPQVSIKESSKETLIG